MKSKMFRIMVTTGFLVLLAAGPAFAGMNGGGSGSGMGAGDERGVSGPSPGSMQKAAGITNISDMLTVSTGSTDSGGVKIDLTPISFEDGILKVKFTVNTHAVNLAEQNLVEQTRLVYGKKEIKPVKADNMGGHHSKGTIIFEVEGELQNFMIVINGIPNQEKRAYQW